jgi:isoquinoline 1-oxidoreductase beta subunit
VVPGMVYAAVTSCPEFGGKLQSVDETPIAGRRGIIAVVKMDDAVAVVADRYWRAKQALDKLKPVWTDGGNATVDSALLNKAYVDALDGPLVTAKNEGDAAAALAQPTGKVVEALYEVPYLAHAPMEPLNCTVQLAADRVDLWLGTQSPMLVMQFAARESGVAAENIHVHNQFLGGGFGRRFQPDEVAHAIAVAKAVKKPVKLIWHREQDIRRDRYRPQAAARFKAVLGAQGKPPTAISTQVAVGSINRSLGISKVENGIEPPATEVLVNHAYKIANNHVGLILKNAHVPVMHWRSVGASQNTFFLESFIDELAHESGQDPYQFRRAMLKDRPDYLGVLDTVAKHGNWGEPMAPGRGRGIAIVQTMGTVAGQVAEVTVSPDGKVRVDRVVAAVDCYHAANPNTIEQQVEGGIIWGLTAALYGEITIKDGAPVQGNFNTYPLLRMNETPKIETYLSLSGGPRWGGIGEPSAAPIAPAVCNAIFAATGKRVRKLPLKNIDLKTA